MSAHPGTRALLVFGRLPVAGRVKTRLIPAIGAEAATRIYRRMLFDTLATAAATRAERRELWLSEPPAGEEVALEAARLGLMTRTQRGKDLGARMHLAFCDALGSAARVVLIGSDCPEISPAYLEAAFAALDDVPVVIGPARDGGYVLLGLRRPLAPLFEDIPWGSDRVLGITRQRLESLRTRWTEMPPLQDIDRIEELAAHPGLAQLI